MTSSMPEPEGRLRLSPGRSLACRSCASQVLILGADESTAMLTCCDSAMTPAGPVPCSARMPHGERLVTTMVVGMVYTDEPTGLRARCTHGGSGVITVDRRPLVASRPRLRMISSAS